MSEFGVPARRIFSVSELNTETKKLLEQRFVSLFVRGEVSNFSAPRSGHWYFTLKDESAQIRVVMFKQANFKYKEPGLGDEIVVGGQVSFYRERGEVQIIAQQLQAAGLGDLQQKFDELKTKLLKEGLFDQSYKLPIPQLPKKVAVITSPTGAVIQDIIRICERRAKSMPILLLPVRVQGDSAADEICEAIEHSNRRVDVDLILLSRGGGSLEDFMAFNEAPVARAIFESNIPVISGVGHESDVSIADFVSDRRAATPSEAAELATEGYISLKQHFDRTAQMLNKQIDSQIKEHYHQLDKLHLGLKNPADELGQIGQKIDHLETRMEAAQRNKVATYRTRINMLNQKIQPSLLVEKISMAQRMLSQYQQRLNLLLNTNWKRNGDKLAHITGMLEALSPLKTMARGYGIALNTQNSVVSSISQVSIDDQLNLRLQDGIIETKVTGADTNIISEPES